MTTFLSTVSAALVLAAGSWDGSLGPLLTMCAATASSVLLRQKIVRKCREDIYHFLNNEKGQIAIYDAVNPLASGRRSLAKEFAKHDIEVGRSI